MEFEKPIMNISMFEKENVVTNGSGNPSTGTNMDNAIADAEQYAAGNAVAVKVEF
ncbi:MAG: hypothetical protein J1G06_05510 [Oscillospiraceae bacterium]|nr:hypothetical protein [Oscillospiraceae bacterium]